MKLFKKNKLIVKFLSLVLTVALTVVVSATDTGYAAYPLAYGNNNPDEEYYIWSRVDSDKKPLYEYLSDGQNQAYKTDSGERKTFRVMLIHHFNREYEDFFWTSSISKIWGGLDVAGDDDYNREHAENQFGAFYTYDFYIQVFADWTRLNYGTNNTLEAVTTERKNKQVRPFAEKFITRGAQRSFICEYDHVWKNGDGDNVGNLATEYIGAFKYHFYLPDKDDRNPLLTLAFGEPHTAGLSPGDFFFWDKDGNLWTEDGKKSGSSNSKSGLGSLGHDTWGVVQKSNGKFKIVAHDRKGDDYALGIDNSGYLYCNNWDDDNDEQENAWIIYVGEPVPSNLLKNMMNSSNDSLSKGNSRTISSPVFLKKEDTYVIGEDAILFVDSVILLRGTIENHGIIIVGDLGGIISWDGESGIINCKGGDIIVKNTGNNGMGLGTIFASKLIAENMTFQAYGRSYFRNADINNSVIDIRRRDALVAKGSQIDDYGNLYVAYKYNDEFMLKFNHQLVKITGNGDSYNLTNVIENFESN